MAGPASWVLAMVLALAAGATFARGVSYGFVWDDHRIIRQSPRMQAPSAALDVFVHESTWIIADGADSPVVTYRPLALSSMALDYAVFRGDPRGFHLTNVVLHVGCVLAFFWLLLRLEVTRLAAFGLALLLAVHPVGAEAITWINGRSEPLCLLFGLVTLGLCAACGPLRPAALVAIAASAGLTLLAKETGIVFTLLGTALLARHADRARLRAGGLALGAGLVAYVALRAHALAGTQHAALATLSFIALPALFYRALQVALVPLDLGLENLVAWLAATSDVQRAVFVAVAVALVGLTGIAAYKRRWLEAIGLAWWLGALAPAAVTLATGGYWPGLCRWVYLALPGLLLALAPALERRISRRAVQAVLLVLALGLALETQRAISVWRNEETLLGHMIERYPSDWYAYYVLGRDRLARGDGMGALQLLQRGREKCGPQAKLTCLEGRTLSRMGRCEEAGAVFDVAPDCALARIDAWQEIGVCYAVRGDLPRARKALSMCKSAACRQTLERLP